MKGKLVIHYGHKLKYLSSTYGKDCVFVDLRRNNWVDNIRGMRFHTVEYDTEVSAQITKGLQHFIISKEEWNNINRPWNDGLTSLVLKE